jgi:hypothetical protein
MAFRMSQLDTWFIPVAVRYVPMGVPARKSLSSATRWARDRHGHRVLSPDWKWDTLASAFGSVFLVGEVIGDSVCLLESFDQ